MSSGLTKVWAVSKDVTVALGVSGGLNGLNLGAGNENHNLVGRITFNDGDVRCRFLAHFTKDWTGVVQLENAELVLTVDTYHGTVGASAYAKAQRVNATWNQGSDPVDGEGVATGNTTHYGNQPGTTGTASAAKNVPSSGKVRINILAAIEEIAPDGTGTGVPAVYRVNGTVGGNAAFYGFQVIATDSGGTEQATNAAYRAGFKSMEGGNSTSEPYIELTYSNNHRPNAPIDLTPTGDALVSSTLGTSATVIGRHTDPDNDSASKYQAQWFPDTATDAVPGAATKDDTVTAVVAALALRSHTFTGLPVRTYGKWRMRFFDGAWGDYCLLQRAKTAYLPSLPAQPYVTPGVLVPDFFASIVSSDLSDYISAVQVIVYQYPTVGSRITKWDSGKQALGGAPTRAQLTYAGSLAAFGTSYRWLVRLWNRDDVPSAYAGEFDWKPVEAIGAAITPNSTATKLDTKTPTFTVSDPGLGNIDQAQTRWYSGTGVLLSDSGVISFTSTANRAFVTPAGIWDWGQQPYVSAAVRVTGNANIGPFSPLAQVHLNAAPGAPYPVTVTGAIRRVDDVWVAPTEEPVGDIPFRDTDLDLGYVEAPTLRDLEIRSTADVLLARIVRKMYAQLNSVPVQAIHSFDQPASLVPTSAGWVAGSTCALSFDAAVKFQGTHALKLLFTNLPTATTSTTTLADGLRLSTLYTDLSTVATAKVRLRRTAGPTGLLVSLRFVFGGNVANYAAFSVTPTADNAWQQFTLTLASPTSSANVNWAQVSGLEIRVSQTSGVNQSLSIYIDDLQAIIFAFGTQRKFRARYDDSAAVRSEYSEYTQVKPSAAPVLTLVSPAAASTITTPRLPIVYSYAGTAAQATQRVTASVAGALVYDSGTVATAAVTATIPGGYLPNTSAIDLVVTAVDTDGQTATLAWSVTSAFTAPAALTGLTVTPDLDAKALLVDWTDSALSAGEFESYRVYARTTGDFILVATITSSAASSYLYYGAQHNVPVSVRVTQSNGWAESSPTETEGLLSDAGYYWLRPEPLELKYLKGGDFSDDLPTTTEEFSPFGATHKIVRTWDTYGAEWRARLTVPAASKALIDTLRADKASGLVGILKVPDGVSYYSRIREVGKTLESGGFFTVDIKGTEVGPAAGSF